LLIAAIAGFGSSDQVRELPEAEKDSILQEKVDVDPRSAAAKKPSPHPR
jgi:hypothetical protein